MKIESKFFGEIEINENEIIYFGHGIPGFESFRKYIIEKQNPEAPFFVMQSVEDPQLAFILIELERVAPGFSIDLSDEIAVELKLAQPEDAVTYAIVVLPAEIAKATVNLAAPIIINTREKQGKQIILNNPAYGLKHPLFSASQGEAGLKTVTR